MKWRREFANRIGGVAGALGVLLAGCATERPYTSPVLKVAPAWSSANVPTSATASASFARDQAWWTPLNDPAINALVDAAMVDSPTLAKAVARIDEARASARVTTARRLPVVPAAASLTRSRSVDADDPEAQRILTSSFSLGPSLSWELDLFGHVRQSAEATLRRLEARTADASAVRLSLSADIASSVLALRACEYSRHLQKQDIVSRELTLALTRRRVAVGSMAPVEEARASGGLANALASSARQLELCTRALNALVALTGSDADSIRVLVAAPPMPAAGEAMSADKPRATRVVIPQPPRTELMLPATILRQHPSVLSAEREVAAAWADMGVARAARLPRVDLTAVLTGHWLGAMGSSLRYATWSIGPSATATLFDGGAGAANEDASEARYREALATLTSAVRTASEEVENALASLAASKAALPATQISVEAARAILAASDAQWRSGATSLFELEDARRQFAMAQDGAIAAERDRSQAWIALVRASGNTIIVSEAVSYEDDHSKSR